MFNIFFAAAIEVVRFSKEDAVLQNLVYLEEETEAGGAPLDQVRRPMTAALYRGPPTDWRG